VCDLFLSDGFENAMLYIPLCTGRIYNVVQVELVDPLAIKVTSPTRFSLIFYP